MRIILKPLGAITLLAMIVLLTVLVVSNAWTRQDRRNKVGAVHDILLVTDAAKKGWLQNQIYRFNLQNEGRYHVTTRFMDTREALQAILHDKEKPVLWSPSGSNWTVALADGWARSHPGGKNIVSVGDSDSYRTFLRTPLVFLTTKNKAPFLKKTLATEPWRGLHALSSGKTKTPWGAFRYSYADPRASNSGFMVLGLIVSDYAARNPESRSPAQAANSDGFVRHLREMQSGFVAAPDVATRLDATALCHAFARGEIGCDLVVAYECDALAEAAKNPGLSVIYPAPTADAEQSVAILQGEWITPEKRLGAKVFLDFLATKESLAEGVRLRFRPLHATDAVSIEPQIARRRNQGFQNQYSTTQLPPYTVVNNADFQWHTRIAVDASLP